LYLFILGLLILSLTACKNNENEALGEKIEDLEERLVYMTEQKRSMEKTLIEQEDARKQKIRDEQVIEARAIEQYPESLYKEETVDLDGDGEKEIVELYVNASKFGGVWGWDDGHMWLLVVKDGNKTYPLFHDWVQMGQMNFAIMDEKYPRRITMFKTEHRYNHVNVFKFNDDKSVFEIEHQYKENGSLSVKQDQLVSVSLYEEGYQAVDEGLSHQLDEVLKVDFEEVEDRVERARIVAPLIHHLSTANKWFNIAEHLGEDHNVTLDRLLEFVDSFSSDEPQEGKVSKLKQIQEIYQQNKDNIPEATQEIERFLEES